MWLGSQLRPPHFFWGAGAGNSYWIEHQLCRLEMLLPQVDKTSEGVGLHLHVGGLARG